MDSRKIKIAGAVAGALGTIFVATNYVLRELQLRNLRQELLAILDEMNDEPKIAPTINMMNLKSIEACSDVLKIHFSDWLAKKDSINIGNYIGYLNTCILNQECKEFLLILFAKAIQETAPARLAKILIDSMDREFGLTEASAFYNCVRLTKDLIIKSMISENNPKSMDALKKAIEKEIKEKTIAENKKTFIVSELKRLDGIESISSALPRIGRRLRKYLEKLKK